MFLGSSMSLGIKVGFLPVPLLSFCVLKVMWAVFLVWVASLCAWSSFAYQPCVLEIFLHIKNEDVLLFTSWIDRSLPSGFWHGVRVPSLVQFWVNNNEIIRFWILHIPLIAAAHSCVVPGLARSIRACLLCLRQWFLLRYVVVVIWCVV